jgi:plastocyanin
MSWRDFIVVTLLGLLKMAQRLSIPVSMLLIALISGLTPVLPAANGQSTVMVSIPLGAGASQWGAPGYSPDRIMVVIDVNNTVTWTNDDVDYHTVTSPAGTGLISSGDMAPGATYSNTFTTRGTYIYICAYHTWMEGTVVVEAAASTNASTSTQTSTTPEFPSSSLAVILFAVVAAVIVATNRLKPKSSSPNSKSEVFVVTRIALVGQKHILPSRRASGEQGVTHGLHFCEGSTPRLGGACPNWGSRLV